MRGLTDQMEIPDRTVDLLVVGLGPAGLACALQANRDDLDVLAVGDEPVGGLIRAARKLSNLPAEPDISGLALAEKMEAQLRAAHLPCMLVHISKITRQDEVFRACLADGRAVMARTLCVATGTRPRPWRHAIGAMPIHRDVRTLPESMAGKSAVLVGGGEAALDTALTCRDRGAEVQVLVRGKRLRAVKRLVHESHEAGIKVRLGSDVLRVQWDAAGWDLQIGTAESLRADELIVCVGREPRDEMIREIGAGQLQADMTVANVPGLVLAGDLVRGRDRYVATAMGDGQRAAIAARQFLAVEES